MSGTSLPAEADTVIIGAGIVGCSTAYHLSTLGRQHVAVVDQGPLFDTGGSTSHAPGFIGQASKFKPMSELAQYTVELFAGLASEPESCFEQVGSLDLAHSEARWNDLKQYAEYGSSWGLDEATLMTPEEVQHRVPLLNTDEIYGGYSIPTDGYARSVLAAEALAQEAEAGGASFHAHTTVTDIKTTNGQVEVVVTDNGRIETHQILLATNIWGPLLGDQMNVEMPLIPVEHQYAVSESVDELANHYGESQLPLVRARDRWIYARQHGDAIGIGSYHDEPTLVDPEDIQDPDDTPNAPALREFSEREFRPALEAMQSVLPASEGVEIDHGINGLFALTPDGMPIIGEADSVEGLWVAVAVWVTQAGGVGNVIAEWMEHGTPKLNGNSFNVQDLHIDRFQSDISSRSSIRDQCANQYHAIYGINQPH